MTLPLLARGGYRPQLATQTLLRSLRAALCLLALVTLPAHAQDPGTLNPQPLPPLPNPDAPRLRRTSFSVARRRRYPARLARSAHMATAVLRVLSRSRSAARPGK